MENKELLDSIVDYYLTSHDFNGLPLVSLDGYNANDLEDLIREGMVEAVSFDDCLNPCIRAYDYHIKTEDQIQNVRVKKDSTVLYPTKKALSKIVTNTSKPYTAKLIKGETQYKIIFFEPQIIDLFASNPKYINHFFGYRGYYQYTKSTMMLKEAQTSISKIMVWLISMARKSIEQSECFFETFLVCQISNRRDGKVMRYMTKNPV